ncbi:MAG: deaminase [Alphaproteobacteria bacterium]
MSDSPYTAMQAAVDIVGRSPHPDNKIAATLTGDNFSLSATNYWPAPIEEKIGRNIKIGSSSGTIHAETACILEASRRGIVTKGAQLFITDPPCPNCMKNMAEAGIKALYIDHKGFDKDFAQRRGHHFAHMSMKIAEHAGIGVYKLFRKEQRIEPIFEVPEGYEPPEENPVIISRHGEEAKRPTQHSTNTPFATCLADNAKGERFRLHATAHPVTGYTTPVKDEAEGRYSFILEPVTRLLMSAARQGFVIEPESFYAAQAPTARELVNLIGAGVTRIEIGNPAKCRDLSGLTALKQLKASGVLKTEFT